MKAEEFAKEKGYFQSPHFPMDHVVGLMYSYSNNENKELIERNKELSDRLQSLYSRIDKIYGKLRTHKK